MSARPPFRPVLQQLAWAAVWQPHCPMEYRTERRSGHDHHANDAGGVMSVILIFLRKWKGWYRVLRYGTGCSFVDSVRLGLWLARG
jgi:hypothetical protein